MSELLTPETGYLSCLLHDGNILYKGDVPPQWISTPRYRKIYDKIRELDGRDVKPDVASVGAESDASAVVEIYDLLPTGANWKYYRDQLEEEYRKRELKKVSMHIQDSEKKDSNLLLTEVENMMYNISIPAGDSLKKAGDTVRPVIETIEERYNNHGLPGIRTGFKELNRMTLGFQKQKYYIVGGRPSSGKSALVFNFARHIMKTCAVGLISIESSAKEVIIRLISDLGDVVQQRLQTGDMSAADFEKINTAAATIYDSALYVYDSPNADLAAVQSAISRMVRVYDIDILFVDYLQLIKYGSYATPQHERIGTVSLAMKEAARKYDIPVVCAAQLNRGGDGTPGISSLKGSGQIEQDADVVIIIDKSYVEDAIGLDVAKNRDGETGIVPVGFAGEYTRFFERVQ